ncbi:MAG: rhodanese-like domain-containing protein [Saprospiraceae bacterium]|nr:rhodanese-like domain-containing protein [Saprospiraceae bacterium]MBK6565988.1 rhodanese-like domain-containing protein [Saprospiraceae bacterium]MBK7525841.1 rhodanese-like domain-containing protein [Saprospiraceae bacterium]MBK8082274.1 rhodanese-like domain-containing protein [Saprospiraceae bacterium]MBK8369993.1 rhodanese-like domain-containing protein [Saprospiraceae bacterium]
MKTFLGILFIVFLTGFNAKAQSPVKNAKLFKEHVNINVSVEKAKVFMYNSDDYVVLDVRTPEEFNLGNIKNSINIDYNAGDFADKIAVLDKTKTYLVYCRSGARSSKAVELMNANGFNYLMHLEGGYLAWQKLQN